MSAAALAASLAAQTPRNAYAVVRVGDVLPNGDTITDVSHPRTNDLGEWAAIVETSAANPAGNGFVLRSGARLFREGELAPGTANQTITDIVDIDLSDDGHLVTVIEATGGFIVYGDGAPLLRENDPATAAGFGPNARFVDVQKVNTNGAGQVLLRCRVFDPAASPQNASCLLRLDLGAGGAVVGQTLYVRSGNTVVGFGAPLEAVSPADCAISFRDDAEGTWAGRLTNAALVGREFAYLNNTTPLAQGNAPAPVGARTFLDVPFQATAYAANGDTFVAALLDPSNTNNDELILRNGAVFLRENQVHPALPGAPAITGLGLGALYVTDTDELVHFVQVGSGATLSQVLLRGNDAILRTGDTLPSGERLVALTGGEHGFHTSDNGRYTLALALLDNATFALVYAQETLGTSYCAAQTNSTGQRAITTARGVSLAHANGLELHTSDAPPTSFGYYITSMTQGDVLFPGGSSGRICLAGSIGRYVTQVGQVSAAGTFAITPNLAAMPTTPNVAAQPGETWNFQMWFRDAGPTGATSNFSLPVAVEFH